ncbi:something about silencing protein 10 [[Candida] jaroonii]|uniref:Something about silencing protein 10 n=1 Tax=[Candida] jaroonii TaxID=467808 RepID=A0ACA9YF42_9ASCO|nr:something about silencing protein 10 [[Candida] jaroonii]
MARRSKPVMPEDDEVDDFHNNQEKILLEQAGEYGVTADHEEDEDEEVLGFNEEDEEDEQDQDMDSEDFDEEEDDEEEEEIEGWGGRKNYYGGDEVEDAVSAKQMTEEAIRQQKENLQELGMDDYVDEDLMEDWSKKAESFDEKSSKKMVINEDLDLNKLDQSEKLELLTSSFPEFIPLLKELNTHKSKLEEFGESQVDELKKVALTAYLSAISSYFSIFVDQIKNNEPFSSMKEHPVMETILTTRQIWKETEILESDDLEGEEEEFVDAEQELSEVEHDMEEVSDEESLEGQGDSDISEISEIEDEEDAEDINIDINAKRTIKQVKPISNDFSEPTVMDDIDEEEKQKKKKSLRFYTAKIDKSALKNDEKFSGDLDLPYKERLFERKQRLIEEARKRGLQSDSANDLDGEDFDEEDNKLVNEVNDNEYYNMIKNSKKASKEDRKLAHKQAVKLAKEGKLLENQESLGEGGKRALNFQIMKNKGLTAKRNKEVRNARVKKRKKFEKAQKKLKSVKQVHESNKGPYEGEKTGIKKGLSRSVKLA